MSATTDKELADLLRWFDQQENVDAVYEEGDPDVGLFPCWIVYETQLEGSLRVSYMLSCDSSLIVALQWARNAKGLL